MKAQPGHLAHARLNLKQTEKVRRELSKAAKARFEMQKLKPVELNWSRK